MLLPPRRQWFPTCFFKQGRNHSYLNHRYPLPSRVHAWVEGRVARGQNLEHLVKVVILCWSFLEVLIFATTYQKTFIVGPKVPYPTQPFPTLPRPAPPRPAPPRPAPPRPYPTLPYPTLPYPTLPYPTLPYPTLPYPTLPYPTHPTPNLRDPTPPHPTPPYQPYPTLKEFKHMHITKPAAVELRCHATALINRIIIQQRSKFKLKTKCLHSTANDSHSGGGGGTWDSFGTGVRASLRC